MYEGDTVFVRHAHACERAEVWVMKLQFKLLNYEA